MAYFPDLSTYVYADERRADPLIVNIGWLSKDEPFTTGDVPAATIGHIQAMTQAPVNLYRGSHTCEFCCRATGNGEIRVSADDGLIYVAPVMVLHYITAHHYCPPDAFLVAVMRERENQ